MSPLRWQEGGAESDLRAEQPLGHRTSGCQSGWRQEGTLQVTVLGDACPQVVASLLHPSHQDHKLSGAKGVREQKVVHKL